MGGPFVFYVRMGIIYKGIILSREKVETVGDVFPSQINVMNGFKDRVSISF